MFMHGGLLHLGGNMLFLWVFGNNVEDSMGPVKYVIFYLVAGLAATAGQVLVDPNAAVPSIGASGAVAGVLGGYILLFPRARVITLIFIVFFFTIIELPALVILGFWFIQQIVFGYFDLNSGGEGGGVAYFAHIGGFVFGLAAIKLFANARKTKRQEAAAWGRLLAMRTAIAFVALAFTTVLGFLTLYVIFETGLDVLSAISLIVVALFFFGIFGALSQKP